MNPATLFGPELRLMLETNDTSEMKTFCETLHPATVAEAFSGDHIDIDDVWRILEQTNIRDRAAIFEYMPIERQVEMVEGGGKPQMARLIEQMSPDDRVDLMRRLDPRAADAILRLVDEADRRDIAELFRHEEDTVGALMTTDYAWLPVHLNAGEALDRLRAQAPDKETLYYVYILDLPERKLVGIVSLRELVLAQPHTRISNIMETDNLITLKVTDDQEQAAREMARYDLLAIPVIDDVRRLVGIVTHDDVIDVVVEEATEDLQRQGAVGPITMNYLEANFFLVWRKRTFWLSCFFVAEMLTVSAMAMYEEALHTILVLALFVPLLIATGGNSGTQSATLIIRAMGLDQVRARRDWFRVLRHEFLMGLALGAALGVLAFGRCYLLPSELLVTTRGEIIPHWKIGIVIAQGVMAICLFGTLAGALIPIGFKSLGVDPAIASSPFVATFVDVLGILVYFGIASAWLM